MNIVKMKQIRVDDLIYYLKACDNKSFTSKKVTNKNEDDEPLLPSRLLVTRKVQPNMVPIPEGNHNYTVYDNHVNFDKINKLSVMEQKK